MSKYYADVSHYHPVIDWAAAKRSCPFLISKATQGTTYVDTTLKQFISGCEKNKIPYWLYTYLNPGSEKAQVDFMLNTCKSLVGSYFIGYILDVEAGNAASDVSTALKYLESKGTKVMIYTGYADYQRYKDVISKKGANTAWWEARYGKNNGAYNVSFPCHSGVDLHQYTSKGATPFTTGSTDLNRLTGLKSESWFTTKLNTSQGIREVNRSEDKKEAVPMPVKVGSARMDENGNAFGGKAGDQTGREVATENWYLSPKGWVVLRAKDPKVAEKLAYAMERACANNNIGYDQGQRNTLYNVVKNLGFDPGKAVTKCETDCSALVRVCLAYAGIHVADYNTSNERAVIMATGKFEQRPDSESKASKYMKRGDILVTKTKGHTVIVLNNGTSYSKSPTTPTTSSNTSTKPSTPAAATPKQQIKAKERAKSFNKAYAKTYKTSVKCHIRDGAGTDKTSLGILPAGVSARCYGYYTSVAGTKWMYVVAANAGITYTAFISSKCLR